MMKFEQQLAHYEKILMQQLYRVQDKKEMSEVILLLIVGILCGLYNPNQVAEELEINPRLLYPKLNSLSAASWKGLLKRIMEREAVELLSKYEKSSAATQSRAEASLSVDNSLVKRLGKALSYVWSGYSGQLKKVTTGQDLLGIVLKINGKIIPLRLVWVSKQGRGSTSKPAVLLREMESLKAWFNEHQIDLTKLGVSFDSWWVGEKFSEQLGKIGFCKQVICGKSNNVLKVGEKKQSLAEHFLESRLEKGWGHLTPASRLKGENPTFGKIVVILFNKPRSKAFALLIPADPLRTCEALRIWANQPAIETFWKRMKQWLGLGKMQLRNRDGAWAELTLRVFAYFFALPLLGVVAPSLKKLTHLLHRKATFAELIFKHFQPYFPATYANYHS